MGELFEAITKMHPGEHKLYHTGFLLVDRVHSVLEFEGELHFLLNLEVEERRQDAWDAYEARLVNLVQRKIGLGTYDYIAQRR